MKSIKQNWISCALALLLAAVILAGLQFVARGHFSDPDGFYHARSSQLISSGGENSVFEEQSTLLEDGKFPWLFHTTWHENYANQHYLYHWLLTPFNTVEKLPVSIVVFALVFICVFLAVLLRYEIRFKLLWIFLLLASSIDFLFRINLVKANAISLALLCAIVFLMYIWHTQKKIWSLAGIALVSGIFVWTYGGFICVPMLLGAYAVAEMVTKRNLKFNTLSKAFTPLLVSILGIITGMALHPQNHNLYSLLYDQLFRTGLGAGSEVPAGNEWLPFNLNWFFKSNILILFTWLFSLGTLIRGVYIDWKNSTSQTLVWWLQITAVGLMTLTLWHRRFVEYWIPFVVLATALTLQPYLQRISREGSKKALQFWQMKVAAVMFVGFVLFISAYNIKNVAISLAGGDSGTVFQEAAQWLEENSEPGDVVLNTQWDQFPQLFYYNSKNYYMVGLDPTFMYIYDPEKYWQWRLIADDDPAQWESAEQLHEIISQDLNAKFIFVDTNRNPDIYQYLLDKEGFLFSFEKENLVVIKLK